MTCKHENAHFALNAASFGDTNVRYLEITGFCHDCRAPMKFRCDQVGVSPDRPMVNVARDKVRLPFLFGDEEYDGCGVGLIVTRVQ